MNNSDIVKLYRSIDVSLIVTKSDVKTLSGNLYKLYPGVSVLSFEQHTIFKPLESVSILFHLLLHYH